MTDCKCRRGRVATRLVQRGPVSLVAILAAALFLAGVLAVFSSRPAHAQDITVEGATVTVHAELRAGETTVPGGASIVFRLTRSGDTSEELYVRLSTTEPNRRVSGRGRPNGVLHNVRFSPGESEARLRVPVLGGDTVVTTGRFAESINALLVNRIDDTLAPYQVGDPREADVPLRAAGDDDFIVSIAAVNSSIAEGDAAEFTLTRTGDLSAALTAIVLVEDPGEAMLGNHWDEAIQDSDYRSEVTFSANSATATVSFPTRPNARDTGDLTLTASVQEDDGLSYMIGSSFSADVTVTDDDTAPELSLSVDPGSVIEGGYDVTFTLTRHGDTSEALENVPFVLRIGPNISRQVWRDTYEEPQDYAVYMEADQESVDLVFQTRYDWDRGASGTRRSSGSPGRRPRNTSASI